MDFELMEFEALRRLRELIDTALQNEWTDADFYREAKELLTTAEKWWLKRLENYQLPL